MPAVTICDLLEETYQALGKCAALHGRSMEAEARIILEEAVQPEKQVGLGTALMELGHASTELILTSKPYGKRKRLIWEQPCVNLQCSSEVLTLTSMTYGVIAARQELSISISC